MPYNVKTGPEAATSARLEIESHHNVSIPAPSTDCNFIDLTARRISARCSIPASVIRAHLSANMGGLIG